MCNGAFTDFLGSLILWLEWNLLVKREDGSLQTMAKTARRLSAGRSLTVKRSPIPRYDDVIAKMRKRSNANRQREFC